MASIYSFFDRGLIISSPLGPLYRVTSIMSQRSLFYHTSGNIFYEAIRLRYFHYADRVHCDILIRVHLRWAYFFSLQRAATSESAVSYSGRSLKDVFWRLTK